MTSSASRTSFGLVDGRPVFVDLVDDSYFTLEPAEEDAFLALVDRSRASEPTPPWPADIALPDGLPIKPAACARLSASALDLAQERRRGRGLDVLRIWRLLFEVRSSIHRRPIAAVLGDCRGDGVQSARRASAETAPMLARRFASARRFVPFAGNCLMDSLALMRWLREHCAGATLVFGVKLDPFAAHCWVQTEDVLLNDRAERVERFAPVRTIECTPVTP